jgi:hypothetical protein
MNMTHITADQMRVALERAAADPAAIENGTNGFALDAIPQIAPGFEWTVGTHTWRVE